LHPMALWLAVCFFKGTHASSVISHAEASDAYVA